jgi:hypothetical protein
MNLQVSQSGKFVKLGRTANFWRIFPTVELALVRTKYIQNFGCKI